MFHAPRPESSFYNILLKIDEDTLAQAKLKGCQTCGGKLDQAHFPRKPRGFQEAVYPPGFELRFSLCCREDGCRKRITTASVRFMGRKVYLMLFILLTSSSSEAHLTRLCRLTKLPRSTLERWRHFWGRDFLKSKFWRMKRSLFMPPLDEVNILGCLFHRLRQSGDDGGLSVLKFLAPAFAPVEVIVTMI